MTKELLAGLVGLILGVLGFWGAQQLSHGSDHGSMSMMAMDDMTRELEGLSGEAFDEKFLEMMIVHHEGAVDMATAARTRAERQEIKDLSESIISAQELEITQMRTWQKEWGFAQ